MKRDWMAGLSALAMFTATPAWGADLGPVYKAPASAPANWSGFYIGAVAGGALQTTIIDDKNCNLSCSSQNLDGSGITAGGTIGWNYQFGSGLVGIESDFSWANFKRDLTGPISSIGEFISSDHSARWNWVSTIRGRAGIVADRTLFYVTGGLAFVDVDVSGHFPGACNARGCFEVSGVKTGFAAGAGAEYALSGPWSVKAEYLYVGLPSKNVHDQVRSSASNTYNVKSDAHILRVGLNYHGHAIAPAISRTPLTSDWSGFYAGAVAGGALQNTVIGDKNCILSCSSQNLDGSGATAGVTFGWNYQFGSALIGLEGDLNWSNFKGGFSDPDWGFSGSVHSTKWNWFSTVRGRAGLVADRALLYATGGLAFVDVDNFARLNEDCSFEGCFNATGVKTGLAAGVGVEYALSGPWSVKAEYLYVGLPAKAIRGELFNNYHVQSDAHILRAGLNYHGHTIAPAAASRTPAFNWSGVYIGAVAGGGLQNTIIDDKNCNLSCSSQNLDGSGATAGGTVGWNYQSGAGVVGIEGDFSWANFKGGLTDSNWDGVGTIHSARWNWFSTIRGRAGLAVDRALVYVTGGLAFVDVDVSGTFMRAPCSDGNCFKITGVKTGIVAGVGAEYALSGPWSVKGEYLYVGLPTNRVSGFAAESTFDTYNAKSDAHILRAGLNYRFSN